MRSPRWARRYPWLSGATCSASPSAGLSSRDAEKLFYEPRGSPVGHASACPERVFISLPGGWLGYNIVNSRARSFTVNIKFFAGPALVLAATLGAQAQTQPGKVGVIAIQQAIISTKDGQKAAADLDAKTAPKKK